MATINCGHCAMIHSSVQEVRECALRNPLNADLTASITSQEPPAPNPPILKMKEGFYLHGKTVYKVVPSQNGRLYAKVLDGSSFRYAPGAMTFLKPEERMTREMAEQYGKTTGQCAICGRVLTNEESIERGIGPICAEKVNF